MAQNLQRRAMAPAWSIGVTTPARAILHLIVVVTMLALFAGHARAGVLGDIGGFFGDVKDWVTGEDSVPGIPSNAACNEYARNAVFNASRNVNLQCGFSGGRYTEDRDAHFNWCKGQITRGQHRLGEAAENEQRQRDEEIDRCNRCNVYGDNANIAAKRNVLLHCGGTGNRWGSGDGHKAWCMGVRASTADAETRARDEVVSQCNARYTPAQLRQCDAYAHKAAKQAEFNSQNNCGGTGPRWTQDREPTSRGAPGAGRMTSAEPMSSRPWRKSASARRGKRKMPEPPGPTPKPVWRQAVPRHYAANEHHVRDHQGQSSRSAAHPKTAARCRPGRPQGSDPRAAGRDRRKRRRVACKARGSARAADGIDQRTAPDQDRGNDRPARVEAQAPAGPVQAEMAEQRAAGDRGNQTRYGRLVSVKALPADPGHTARDRRNRGRDHVKAGHTAGDRRNGRRVHVKAWHTARDRRHRCRLHFKAGHTARDRWNRRRVHVKADTAGPEHTPRDRWKRRHQPDEADSACRHAK